MKLALPLAVLFSASAAAADSVNGYVQETLVLRAADDSACAALTGCKTMVNEQRGQLLGEWHPTQAVGATLRADAYHDAAIGRSRLVLREGYADFAVFKDESLRAGRQVITWGVGDYLFVNDIFPKNYDAFFTGKPFDHMKEAVDAVKVNGLIKGVEVELVVAAPKPDEMPSASRFVSTALPPGMQTRDTAREGVDIAVRMARKVGNWDGALYAGRYRSRERGLYGVQGGFEWEAGASRHIGASATGAIGAGVALAEIAFIETDLKSGNMNPYFFGRRMKALLGYARDVGADLSLSVQYHIDTETDYDAYRRALAPMVQAAPQTRQTMYFKVQQRLLHQTLGLGVQLFAAFDGGKYVNPFASYSIADGLNLEVGSNWFSGPTTSPYGMMKHDRNVYTSLRYSF